MKTRSHTSLLVAALALATWTCKGEMGDAGAAGLTGPTGGPGATGPQGPAGPPGPGRTMHWANVVGATGSLFGTTPGITSARTATGTYDLTFPSGTNLNSGCASLATPIDDIDIVQTIAGPRFGSPANLLRVRVATTAGVAVDHGFTIAVFC